MDMFDEARALAVTMKMRKMSQREMAKSLGVSQSYVSNKLRLLKISEKMQKRIVESNLSERHARALLKLKSEEARQEVLDRIINESLSVNRTEAVVDGYYLAYAPSIIGRGDGLKRIDVFLKSLSESVSILSAAGVRVHKTIRYENDTLCISVFIENA